MPSRSPRHPSAPTPAGRGGPLRRRTLLSLPALGALGLAATACADQEEGLDPVDPQASRPAQGRTAYGEGPSQFGDLYLPEGEPRGVVVVLHGGFWRAEYGLDLGQPLAESLAEQGWAAWNLEYRRVGTGAAGGGGVPETLDDVAAGIDALRDLGLDLTTVVTLGHSAGGHLATWAASRGRFEPWAGGVEVTHVVSQAGVVDLGGAARQDLGGGAVQAFLGHDYGPDDAPVDPLAQVPLDVPVWCVHGSEDTIVPVSQSETYVDAAVAAGARAELVRVEGDHFVVIDPDSEAWTATLAVLDSIV